MWVREGIGKQARVCPSHCGTLGVSGQCKILKYQNINISPVKLPSVWEQLQHRGNQRQHQRLQGLRNLPGEPRPELEAFWDLMITWDKWRLLVRCQCRLRGWLWSLLQQVRVRYQHWANIISSLLSFVLSSLLDSSISDDSSCAKIIWQRHGFNAW